MEDREGIINLSIPVRFLLRYTKGEQVVQREGEWGERVSQEEGGGVRDRGREAEKQRG